MRKKKFDEKPISVASIKTIYFRCLDCGCIVKKSYNDNYIETSIGRCSNCHGSRLRLSVDFGEKDDKDLLTNE